MQGQRLITKWIPCTTVFGCNVSHIASEIRGNREILLF